MAKVIAFPTKKELPQHLEEQLYLLGKDYVATLFLALTTAVGTEFTKADMEEINELANADYIKGMQAAIKDLEGP